MTMDVQQFLRDHNINYRTDGPNCSRGGIVIQCPFCGDDDPSEHMGWDLETAQWNCLRRSGVHSGRKPHKLIRQLLGCSYDEADHIAGGQILLETNSLTNMLDKFATSENVEVSGRDLRLPTNFRPLQDQASAKHYRNYLIYRRGFPKKAVATMHKHYDLHYCVDGYWHGRIIFPLRLDGNLVGWTSRTISERQGLRYMSLSDRPSDSGQPLALRSVKNMIWNYDTLLKKPGSDLVLVEGPIDALKIDSHARKMGVRATCLFGTGVTDAQMVLLAEVLRGFRNFYVLGDAGAHMNVMGLMKKLSVFRPKRLSLPGGVEDPGKMTPLQVTEMVHNLIT